LNTIKKIINYDDTLLTHENNLPELGELLRMLICENSDVLIYTLINHIELKLKNSVREIKEFSIKFFSNDLFKIQPYKCNDYDARFKLLKEKFNKMSLGYKTDEGIEIKYEDNFYTITSKIPRDKIIYTLKDLCEILITHPKESFECINEAKIIN